MAGHLLEPPDLTMLPDVERPPLARALAKKPNDRWPNCRTFVEELIRCQVGVRTAASPPPHPALVESSHVVPVSPSEGTCVAEVAEGKSVQPHAGKPAWFGLVAFGLVIALAIVLGRQWPSLRDYFNRHPEPDIDSPDHKGTNNAKDIVKNGDSIPDRHVVGERMRYTEHQGPVRCVCFVGNDRVLSGGDDGTMHLWNATTGKPIHILKGHQGPVNGIAVTVNGLRALSAGADHSVRLWDLGSGKEIRRMEGEDGGIAHTASAQCVAFSPGEIEAASGGEDTRIRLWKLETGKEIRNFGPRMEESIWSIAFAADGNHALTAGDSHSARWWDVRTGKQEGVFDLHQDTLWSVALLPGGKWAASGGGDDKNKNDFSIRVWDLPSGPQRHSLIGHTGAVGSIAIAPDGKRILSGGADCTVRLWDVGVGKESFKFEHEKAVTSVAFSPNGELAVSASHDGSVRIWTLP